MEGLSLEDRAKLPLLNIRFAVRDGPEQQHGFQGYTEQQARDYLAVKFPGSRIIAFDPPIEFKPLKRYRLAGEAIIDD